MKQLQLAAGYQELTWIAYMLRCLANCFFSCLNVGVSLLMSILV